MSKEEKNQNETRENIIFQDIEEEMRQSYIDYAMSVIISRALPDVRDWLKPVQRRILYAMHGLKLSYNSKHKKSASVVWEVMWKYHPHGDSSIYEAMVRTAQDFSLRYPLVDWQWNFGSIDWDWAAAMRYTEARLTKFAQEILSDLDKDTIDWLDNYDNSRKEPACMPSKVPNLLCNWTMWIAVWMATNMPPHNLTEICDALIRLIQNPETTHDEIMTIVSWPDFPTWWIIFDRERISEIYKHWRWSIFCRWKVHIEREHWNSIIIDELPYQTNKSNFVAKIWELAWAGKLSEVKNIIDESNKWKIRISIDLKPWMDPKTVLIKLYKLTELQTTFPVNNILLSENWKQPNLLWIKWLLEEFIKFRQDVIFRRSQYLLNKAEARLHILEWLQKAISIIDDVIHTIRNSKTREEAKVSLMKKFEFTDPQAEYILMLRLQTLVWLEIEKILNEIDEKRVDIDYLTWLVTDETKLNTVMTDEINYIKSEYWDERRTEVRDDSSIYNLDKAMRDLKREEDFLEEDVLVRRSVDEKIKIIYQTRVTALPEDTYKLYETNNQERVFLVDENWNFINPRLKDMDSTNIKWASIDWRKYWIKSNIVYMELTDHIWDYLVLVTNKNSIKKISKEVLIKLRSWGRVMKLQSWEKVMKVISVNAEDKIWLITKNWYWLIYNSDEIRSMWRLAWWVIAMWIEEWDEIVDMFNYHWNMYLAMFSDAWNAKSILTEQLKIKRRWRVWDVFTKLSKGEKIIWAINLDEWDIKILLSDWQVRTFDIDDVSLLSPKRKMEKIVGWNIKKLLF